MESNNINRTQPETTKPYDFSMRPEHHEPSGYADFSRINTPKNTTLTYTDLETRETNSCTMIRTETIDENGDTKFNYICATPVVKK